MHEEVKKELNGKTIEIDWSFAYHVQVWYI
jgi:hypothetical protein